MSTTARIPSRRAAAAIAWPWLPDDQVTTPPSRSADENLGGGGRMRTARLERPSELKALGLHEHPSAGHLVKQAAARQRRADHVAGDARGRLAKIVKGWRKEAWLRTWRA